MLLATRREGDQSVAYLTMYMHVSRLLSQLRQRGFSCPLYCCQKGKQEGRERGWGCRHHLTLRSLQLLTANVSLVKGSGAEFGGAYVQPARLLFRGCRKANSCFSSNMHATCSYGEDGARLDMGEAERSRGIEAKTAAAEAAGNGCGEKRGFCRSELES